MRMSRFTNEQMEASGTPALRCARPRGTPPRQSQIAAVGAAMIDDAMLHRLQRLGGDKLLGRMIDLFLENTPSRIASAVLGERDGNVKAVERAAHSLKSTAGNLGAGALQRIAEQIEDDAAAERTDRLASLLCTLELEYARVAAHLQERRNALQV